MAWIHGLKRAVWRQRFGLALLVGVLLLAGVWSAAGAGRPQVVGAGVIESCSEAAFDSALAALQAAGGGTLTFDCGGPATIVFTSHKTITTPVIIDGGGLVTLSGGNTTRHFVLPVSGSLTLRSLALVDGNSGADYGGSIYVNGGTLVLQGSTIHSSGTAGFAGGAIIAFLGSITLEDSLVDANESSYGAINSTGRVTILRSTLRGNTASTGGGALSVGGEVLIEDSLFENNRAAVGGAIYTTASARVQIHRSTFLTNQADAPVAVESMGGAIINYGSLSIERSFFGGNSSLGYGGAILSGPGSGEADLFIQESTFTGNIAGEKGGAIDNRRGSFNLVNSTLSENQAAAGGGLVNFLGPAYIYFSTFANNSGGSLLQTTFLNFVDNSRQQMILFNSVLAGGSPNCDLDGDPGPLPHFTSGEFNLSDDASCAFFLDQAGDMNSVDPLLGPLADNGGLVYTHLPAQNSPLVDAADCISDFANDQRQVWRPQGPRCDIGAVEVTPPGAVPTPLPSPTLRPTVTPAPTFTVPVPGAQIPAPELIHAGGQRPTIRLNTDHGYGGQPIAISGQVVAGTNAVRIFSMERGQTVGAATAFANAQGLYQVTLNVPAGAAPGASQVCAAAVGLPDAELACAPFTIDPMPPGGLVGKVQAPGVSGWDAQVMLMDARGRLAHTAPIDASGNYALQGVAPGKYQAAITGLTTANVDKFEVTIYPQRDTTVNPLANVNVCLPGDGDGIIMLSRNFQLNPANVGFDAYDAVAIAQVHPLTLDTINIQLNKTLFQREYYGYYVAGVDRHEDFLVYPQLRSNPEGVIFKMFNADGTLVEEKPMQRFAPYEVTFNVGKLSPSSKSEGDPYIEAALVINGQPEPCPTQVKIRVIADPMADSRLRQDSRTWWDQQANAYRFSGVIPNIPGLPFNFPIPPMFLPDLPFFERFQNRLDAGVYFDGYLTEDGLVKVQVMTARAEAVVMNAVIISPTQFKPVRIGDAENSLKTWRDFRVDIPTFSLLPKSPLEVGMPFVATPALSLFGLIEITVGTSAKAAFDVTLGGYVQPFKPNVTAVLTPWGSAEAELTLGAGIGSGLVSTGAGPGFRLKVSTPLTARLFPKQDLSIQACPELTVFLHVYAQAAWGLVGKHHYENLVTLNDCFDLASTSQMVELGSPPPDVFAAPAVAAAPDGRVLTAFVENTGDETNPQVQIITNLQGPGINLRQAVSEVAHSAANPVVAFVGPGDLPLVAWVEKPYDAAAAQQLGSDLNSHIIRQEIFYSIFQDNRWSNPRRLTHDMLGDGMPALAGDRTGAVLAWVRDLDGNFGTRADQRIAVSMFVLEENLFEGFELLSPALNGLNGDVRAAFRQGVPTLVWVYDADASLPSADDRRLVIAAKNGATWQVEMPANLPARVDSPAISADSQGLSLSFLVRQPNGDGQVGLLGANGQVWTARKQQGQWNAAPLRGSEGEFITGEQPVLASLNDETLLVFRRFGESFTYAGLGQVSLSRMQSTGQFSAPSYMTNNDHQNWQPALAIDPMTQQAIVIKVSREAWQGVQGAAADRAPVTAMLSAPALAGAASTRLNAAPDPVEMVILSDDPDPAADSLLPLVMGAPANTQLDLRVSVRNAGRRPASGLQVSLYHGTPGSGTLLETRMIAGELVFNQSTQVVFTITTLPGQQVYYAQVSGSENLTPSNDTALLTLGQLSAPGMAAAVSSAFTPGAMDVSWYPARDEAAASYRVLRADGPQGSYEVLGETSFARFTDTLVQVGQVYCYKVQSYNGAGNLSPLSAPVCAAFAPWSVGLPMINR